MLLRAMVGPTGVVDGLLALQAPNLLDSLNKGDVTAELRASRRFGVQLGQLLTRSTRFTYFCTAQISKFFANV